MKSSITEIGLPVLYLLDTVSLPFVDDFSRDRSTARSFPISSDTLLQVTGDCLYSLPGIELSFESMLRDTAWSYSYDLVAGQLIVWRFQRKQLFSGTMLDVSSLLWIRSFYGLNIIAIPMTHWV